jgi:RNA polymerase sigma-70 factor, ECF subfamily
VSDDAGGAGGVEAPVDEQGDGGLVEAACSRVGDSMTERDNMATRLAAAVPGIAARIEGHEDEVDAALQSRWDEARAAWPALTVAEEKWLAAVGAGLVDATAPAARLGELHAADLYLAQACAMGDAKAIAAFDDACRDTVLGSLRSMGLADDVIADVAQDVRAKLFAGASPRIGTYTGRASLKTWTRTVATRAAVSRMRVKKPATTVDDEVLAALPSPDDGPDEQHFRAKYKVELKAAFEEAMASLTPQQRNVLRHHYIDALSIDEIGALYGVHRTTAFRWLETARATLAKRTQSGFQSRIRATPSEMQSIVRLLQSNIELSLQRVLSEEP